MIEIGDTAPDFELPDQSGKIVMHNATTSCSQRNVFEIGMVVTEADTVKAWSE
jgi:hypothetical protein